MVFQKDQSFRASIETKMDEGGNPTFQHGWMVIEDCLETVGHFKLYEDSGNHIKTNLNPVMEAAADQSCGNVDLVYYLLRKNPSVLLGLEVCG